MMATMSNPTPEERVLIEGGRRVFEKAEHLPTPSSHFRAKMDEQALTNAALSEPGSARGGYLKVIHMPYNEFEAEFADVLNTNADQEEDRADAAELLYVAERGDHDVLRSAQAFIDRDERLLREHA